MALVKASRDALLKPLQVVAGIVEKKNTMPILANVLIQKQGTELRFVATDTEMQISTIAHLGGDSDDMAITVSARKVIDVLRALPDASEVALSIQARKASITAGKSRVSLQTMAAEEFPQVLVQELFTNRLTVPQKAFKHLLSMVSYAMAQQDIRYYLNGLLLVTDDKKLKLVATDGHRLAYCDMDLDDSMPRQDLIVPRKTVGEWMRLLQDVDDPISLEFGQQRLRASFGGIELVSKLIEGKFPDYERVIPQGLERVASIDRALFASSLQRASIVTTEKFKGVRLSFQHDALTIQTNNADQEEAVDEIAMDYAAERTEIGFNVQYLLEVLQHLKTDQVCISLRDGSASALITVPNHPNFKYVVMPMRI
jgi:DNA polymerase-3 subunit beta